MITHLLIVDPQNDFCNPNGSLYVKNADNDVRLLTRFVEEAYLSIDAITVTLDSHHVFQIFHPIFWLDEKGINPEPFTTITLKDFNSGKFKVSKAEYHDDAKRYLIELEKKGRYNLTIWPYHCLTGTYGASIVHDLERALVKYQLKKKQNINFIVKGTNLLTDHFSAIMAEVIDEIGNNEINFTLINELEKADRVLVAGEALSHCVANTVLDIAKYRNNSLDKYILLTDTTSPVAGFDNVGVKFIEKAKSIGMKMKTTPDILDEDRDER